MFKRLLILTSLLSLKAAAFPSMQLIVPENKYAITSNDKPVQTLLERSESSNDVTQVEEDESNVFDIDNIYAEAAAAHDSQQSDDADTAAASYASAKAYASASIEHHVFSPETIPLPLKITTRPGVRTVIAPETITIHEPTIAKIGEVIQQIPTAVSHQSQTVVHKHARVVTPIVAPAVRTIQSQVLRTYQTPLIYDSYPSAIKVVD